VRRRFPEKHGGEAHMTTLPADLRLALRSFVKRPGFTLPIIFTLALGIGANTAVFSIVYSLVLKPPAFPVPDRVTVVNCTQLSFTTAPAAYREYVDWRDQNRVFEEIGGAWPLMPVLTEAGEPERLRGARVTASLLRVFAAPPIAGRWFTEDEDRPGGPNVAIMTESLWTSRFGRDPAVIGRAITLDGVPRTIVGVMPDAPFEGLYRFEVLVPLAMALNRQDGLHNLLVVARLKPGVTMEQARNEMVALGRRLAIDNRTNHGINVRGYRESLAGARVAPAVLMLFGVVTVVLLIACANVANLLLARATSRRREIAVRVAMGAGRLQLASQLLVESTLLALGGGALGVAVAWAGVRALLAAVSGAAPRMMIAMLPSIHVGWHVLVFALGVALATGVLFGLAPMLGYALGRTAEALKEESGRSSGSLMARRMGSVLVVAEIALSIVLLTGAGLLVKSLVRLGSERTGFAAERVLAFDLSLPEKSYATPDSIRTLHRQALARLQSLPGVAAAGMTTGLPMYNATANASIDIDGRKFWKEGESPLTDMAWVGGDYFDTLGVRLVRGRYFTEQDDGRAPMVAVVNESMAAKCWAGDDPIGKQVRIWGQWRQVVGIVADVRSQNPATPAAWKVDAPAAQQPQWARNATFTVRASAGDPAVLATAVRREIAAIDPTLVVANVQTMDDVVNRAVGPWRLISGLMSVFAALAALLAAIGTYGLMAYTVGQRTWEFGVRMAMGADRAAVLRLVLARGMKLAAFGVVWGGFAAAGAARLMTRLLYQVTPNDPWVLGATCFAAVLAALAACYVPARAASRVEPIVTLRAL
jgi:putative ABC transport system permease protein